MMWMNLKPIIQSEVSHKKNFFNSYSNAEFREMNTEQFIYRAAVEKQT